MDRRSRRLFLQGSLALASVGLLAGCASLPTPARAPSKTARIGFLSASLPLPNSSTDAFREGLRELGYVEGQSIVIEYRFAEESSGQLPSLAAELVGLAPDVLLAWGGPAIVAAKQASSTLPIVFPISGDPVAAGWVASLARPGGNLTGLSSLATGLAAKRLELLAEVVPGISRVAVLWNPTNPTKQPEFAETVSAARSLGIQLQSLEVRGPDDFAAAFEAAASGRAEALFVLAEPLTVRHTSQIVEFSIRSRLASAHELSEYAEVGGLMNYGANRSDLFRRAATYVDKILKGAKPADLPVEQPTKFDFVINLNTAQALGLTIPQSVLLQATEVIQ